MTTQLKIREWLDNGKELKATHMIVVCDTYDHEDYPHYVTEDEDVYHEEYSINQIEMQKVMEIYSYKLDLETQLDEMIAFHR